MENKIDQSLCKNCKLCTEVCPIKIIGQNGSIHFKQEREHLCLQCGQCMAICQTKAINVKGLSYENDFHELPSDKLDYDGFMNLLSGRRSVRTFKNQSVDDKMIDQIIDSVSYAPFGAAPEKMELSIINNRETIELALPIISDFFNGLVKKVENPIASFFIKRIAGEEEFQTIKNHLYPIAKSGNYKLENGDGITRGAPSIIIIHAAKEAEAHTNNGIIYATYIMLAAHAIGLGATMVELVPAAINRNKKLKDIFHVPEENEAVMSVIIGHPKYRYKRTIKRNKHKIQKVK
jgi:ferredoxin